MVSSVSDGNLTIEHLKLFKDLQTADTDNKRGISQAELHEYTKGMDESEMDPFLKNLKENFEKIDVNGDGQITKIEARPTCGMVFGPPPGLEIKKAESHKDESLLEKIADKAVGLYDKYKDSDAVKKIVHKIEDLV